MRCCRPKKFGRLPEGLFPIRTNPPKPALSLAPHHVLASLVKGRWLDGKAQALILLLSVCDTPIFFYLSNFSAVKTEGLSLHQPFRNRTIPLAFRRARVCVCLVGFASLQSPWAHTLKASLPYSPLPLHRPFPFLQPLQKDNNPSPHINLSKPHHPSKIAITIAPLKHTH